MTPWRAEISRGAPMDTAFPASRSTARTWLQSTRRRGTRFARARRGDGPTLIEAVTYRIGGHSSTAPDFSFMDLDLMRQFKERDPLHLLRTRMVSERVAIAGELDKIERDARDESENAISIALRDPWPAEEEAARGVYA